MDIIITLPSNIKWSEYEKELKLVQKKKNILNFKVNFFPKNTIIGDKCYINYKGNIIGWMKIVGFKKKDFICSTTGKKWQGNFIERSGEFNHITPIPMKGFQGFRYFNKVKKFNDFINESNKWKEILKPKSLDKVLKDLNKLNLSPQKKFEFACENGILPLVKELLKDERVDPSYDKNVNIVLASYFGYLEVIKELLKDERVDPSDNGNESIQMASMLNHIEVVKELLKDERIRNSLDKQDLEKYKKQVKNNK